MADIDYNALGQAIDSTWGRSSTPKTASYSVKMSLAGDVLKVSYAAIVNFGTERQMIEMKRAYASEAQAIVEQVVKKVKEIYKDLSGSTLQAKLLTNSVDDSIEIISMNVHNARRTAYFRRKAAFELG